MVIDTSALVAILLQEPEAERLGRAIAGAALRLLSSASLAEAGMVMYRRFGEAGEQDLDHLLLTLRILIVPVSAAQAGIARQAHRTFGKGLHPAGLNYGDCFSYALAKERGEPLLFKGNDFSRTDLTPAAY